MERFELLIKKVIEGRKKLVYNFLIIEFILVSLSVLLFMNRSDSRYFNIACFVLLLATVIFIGFRMLNNDLLYCSEYYKVDKIQVIRKLQMNNHLIKVVLVLVDFHHLKVLIKKAHEAILYVNKYKERVELGPWVVETDFDKNKNLRNEEECQQNLNDPYSVMFYKITSSFDSKLKDYFNALKVNLNYPTDIDYEVNEGKITYEVTYKVYGFMVNDTTILIDEESVQHLDINDYLTMTLDDSNLDSIKYEIDPYFEIKLTIKNREASLS